MSRDVTVAILINLVIYRRHRHQGWHHPVGRIEDQRRGWRHRHLGIGPQRHRDRLRRLTCQGDGVGAGVIQCRGIFGQIQGYRADGDAYHIIIQDGHISLRVAQPRQVAESHRVCDLEREVLIRLGHCIAGDRHRDDRAGRVRRERDGARRHHIVGASGRGAIKRCVVHGERHGQRVGQRDGEGDHRCCAGKPFIHWQRVADRNLR